MNGVEPKYLIIFLFYLCTGVILKTMYESVCKSYLNKHNICKDNKTLISLVVELTAFYPLIKDIQNNDISEQSY